MAREGLKPGWDIQYCDDGELTAVEVKGTGGPLFASVEVTAQEWRAAESFGERYWLYLVADCLSTYPSIQRVQDPFALSRSNTLRASQLAWRLELAQVTERGA